MPTFSLPLSIKHIQVANKSFSGLLCFPKYIVVFITHEFGHLFGICELVNSCQYKKKKIISHNACKRLYSRE